MKTDSAILLGGLALLGGIAYFILKRSDTDGIPSGTAIQGNNSRFTSTNTASPPPFWGQAATPVAPIVLKPKSDSSTWEKLGAGAVNALASYAQKLWQPNTKVATTGGGKVDSAKSGPGTAKPVQATTFDTVSSFAIADRFDNEAGLGNYDS